MKKISTEEKQWLLNRGKKKFAHELKRERKKEKLKYVRLMAEIRRKRNKKFLRDPDKTEHTTCIANQNFSILNKTKESIDYFDKAIESFSSHKPVYFDLSNVETTDTATLTYLCALVNDKKITKETPLGGNLPKTSETREMFLQSGFHRFVSSSFNEKNRPRDEHGELIHKTDVRVEPKIAKSVCLSAFKHTYGIETIKAMDVYKIIIECMANTHNHANFGNTKEIYNWWLLAYKDSSTKITKFCFLDMGVGIFGSLKIKYQTSNLPEWLKNVFAPNENIKTIKRIYSGETETSTNLPERGRGLLNIYNLVKRNSNIKNFTLITNDIKTKISYNTDDEIIKLENNFDGTLYYWELTPNENN